MTKNKLKKFNQKYLELLEQFFSYMTIYRLNKFSMIPKKSNIVIFDDQDSDFSYYSEQILSKLLKSNVSNVFEVRKTGVKSIPWKISQPVNILTS